MVYEIVRPDNSILTRIEMSDILKNTGIETTQVFYDNQIESKLSSVQEIVNEIMKNIEDGTYSSSLGGKPEGIVVKVINVVNKNEIKKISNTRYKYVRKEFSEMIKEKRDKLPQVSDEQFINELGEIYNTNARKQKAIQHLKEKGNWKEEM